MIVWRAGERQVQPLLDDAIWALLGSLVMGRAVFVALTWGYFQSHPIEIPAFWAGGLSGPGALAGGIIALLIRIRFWPRKSSVFDELAPLAGCLAIFAWLGCWLTGEAYGREISGWPALLSGDEWGRLAPRLPVQPAGALLTLLLIYLVDRFRARLKLAGQQAALGMAGLGLIITLLSFLRADPALVFGRLRADSWAGLAFTALGLAWFAGITVRAAMHRRAFDHQPAWIEETKT